MHAIQHMSSLQHLAIGRNILSDGIKKYQHSWRALPARPAIPIARPSLSGKEGWGRLLFEELTKRKKDVLFLIDEIRASTPEMRVFATTYQRLVGDGMNVVVAMAGLPNAISS